MLHRQPMFEWNLHLCASADTSLSRTIVTEHYHLVPNSKRPSWNYRLTQPCHRIAYAKLLNPIGKLISVSLPKLHIQNPG